MTAIAQTARISGRHIHAFVRQPWFVVMSVVQPAIWLLLFGALFSNVTRIPGFAVSSYVDYLVPGVVVMTALFWCGWSGMSLISDIWTRSDDEPVADLVRGQAGVGRDDEREAADAELRQDLR
jgi:ABC-2 type transporter